MSGASQEVRLEGVGHARWWRENRRWMYAQAADGIAYARWWRANRGGQNHLPRYLAYCRAEAAK